MRSWLVVVLNPKPLMMDGRKGEIPYTAQSCQLIVRRVDDAEQRTRSNDRHVDQNVQPDLPVRQRGDEVTHLEVLFLSNRRVVVFWGMSLA